MTSTRCPVLIASSRAATFGEQCTNRVDINPNEFGIYVCKLHKHFSQERLNDNINKVRNAKQLKDKREENKIGNIEIIKKHPGEIPLYNNMNEIVNFAQVSPEDFERVNKHSWHLNIYPYNENNVPLHQFIIGKDDNMVPDHTDHNKLNNKRDNLRFATMTQNSQNKKKREGVSSSYIGVCWREDITKWCAKSIGTVIGNFDDEIDAAKAYDSYVLLEPTLGNRGENHVKTNNLVTINELEGLTVLDILHPRHSQLGDEEVFYREDHKKYVAQVRYPDKSKTDYKECDTEEEAKGYKKQFIAKRDMIIKNLQTLKTNMTIPVNAAGYAIIKMRNQVEDIIVDHDQWQRLNEFSWHVKKGEKVGFSIQSDMDGKKVKMGRFIMNAPEDYEVFYTNKNQYDNRVCNLILLLKGSRLKTDAYYGVSQTENMKFRARVSVNKIPVHLGTFETARLAAEKYNEYVISHDIKKPLNIFTDA